MSLTEYENRISSLIYKSDTRYEKMLGFNEVHFELLKILLNKEGLSLLDDDSIDNENDINGNDCFFMSIKKYVNNVINLNKASIACKSSCDLHDNLLKKSSDILNKSKELLINNSKKKETNQQNVLLSSKILSFQSSIRSFDDDMYVNNKCFCAELFAANLVGLKAIAQKKVLSKKINDDCSDLLIKVKKRKATYLDNNINDIDTNNIDSNVNENNISPNNNDNNLSPNNSANNNNNNNLNYRQTDDDFNVDKIYIIQLLTKLQTSLELLLHEQLSMTC